jgi:pimeloyl-ACP methyl ester carboxylesterase
VFLIPGFFGFVNFGRLVYFSHVREYLEDAFARERLPVEIHRVRLPPTASLVVRNAALEQAIREAVPNGAPVHLVGHSTGGLDARLLCSRDNDLAVKSVVSIATPHRGTPLAAWFTSLLGQDLLKLLSLATIITLRVGRVPVGLLASAGAQLAKFSLSRSSPPRAVLEALERELLGKVGGDERALIGNFVDDVHGDQRLMPELTPEAMELFDNATKDRAGVRYGCVTASAPPPSLRTRFSFGLQPWAQAEYSLYAWLHRRVGDGDGIVPLSSQTHGERLYRAKADHLDVIGHFDDERHRPPHIDWLVTGSKFDRAQFEALWSAVASFVAKR